MIDDQPTALVIKAGCPSVLCYRLLSLLGCGT